MSAMGFGMGFENVQKALAMIIARRQQEADMAKEQGWRESQALEQRRQFDIGQQNSQAQLDMAKRRAQVEEAGAVSSLLNPNEELNESSVNALKGTPFEARLRQHSTLGSGRINPDGTRGAVSEGGRNYSTLAPTPDQQERIDRDAARHRLTSMPGMEKFAPFIQAGVPYMEDPSVGRNFEAGQNLIEHNRGLARIEAQGKVQERIARIQKASTTTNSAAARFITAGLPRFDMTELAEMDEDEAAAAIQRWNMLIEARTSQAKQMFPGDIMFGGQGGPPAKRDPLDDLIDQALGGPKP